MKLTIDLDEVYGYEDETLGQTIKDLIKYEVKAAFGAIIKDEIKKKRAKAEEAVREAVNKNWDAVFTDLKEFVAKPKRGGSSESHRRD